MARKVFITMKSFKNICEFSSQYASNYIDKRKWAESMGYLFCRRDGDKYIISDAVGMSRGGETYVSMTPDDLARIEQLEREHPNDFLGGWWHTHPGLSPFFSETDIQNQMFYQAQNEDGLGLVFDHSMVDENFIGFKIFRLDNAQDPLTKYHEVPWYPLGWTESGLKEALSYIGVADIIVERLAYKLRIRKEPPTMELPPFTMPKIKDEAFAKKLIERTEQSSEEAYERGDITQALVSKRVYIALLEKYEDDIERLADEMITFCEWALEHNKFLSAKEMLQKLDLLIVDRKVPDDLFNYYKAKYHYLSGLAYMQEYRYANAAEEFGKAIPLFEQEEVYEEECANAAEHIAECYEKQKEFKEAINWISKAMEYAKQAIDSAEEDAESEEDEEEIQHLKDYYRHLNATLMILKAKLAQTNKGPTKIV